ncbi:MAG TPA: LysR substrate-binding domain-containing protein [Hypericibacter adhaerens]|jgi:DNA-binding transcriptional LysR family regulator|uniref:LysR family transcriptional regulator n=1 Tax=Hypericibacter adhaerens TaxID=2602016 RepID=A0A5J6N3U9_9PROT|nr:LysR substrate-binding domain-containing protein [Hypericibacter adhaerens]QEX24712.1 LysR family transcriptional regulator [Hypericibacter adhaerens]HWA44984.1 LysR substrate-binding domain-containing protein [Hypericibacter adhaerens]
MELRHIKYFLAVAEELHFRKAAEALHISQPPLSQQIRQLEDELKVALFARNKRGVSLTPAGKRFLPHARRILAAVDSAVLVTRQGVPNLVKIGFVSSASMLLAPIMKRFRDGHPTVDLRLVEASTSRQGDMLRAGELDIGLLRAPWTSPGFVTETVARDKLAIILANDHPRAGDPKLKLADLADERFVFFPRELGPGYFDTVMAACNRAGLAPDLDQVAGSTLTIINLVAAGQGFSLVPLQLAAMSKGVTVHLPDDLEAETLLVAAYVEDKKDAELTRSLVTIFRTCAQPIIG